MGGACKPPGPKERRRTVTGVSPKWVKSRRSRKNERKKKSEKTMASFVNRQNQKKSAKHWPASLLSTTTGGARKPPGPKKVSENNGHLGIHGSHLDQFGWISWDLKVI